MPGIFGAAGARARIDDAHLQAIAARLRDQPALATTRIIARDGRAAVGGVDLRLLPGSGLPFEAADGSLAVVYGEIPSLGEGPAPAATLLERYRADAAALTRLRGSYAAAIWDAPAGRLVLTNDRFGLRNVYYALDGDTLWFAPRVGALLAVPTIDRGIDLTAITDFLALHRVLATRTLVAAVTMLPPASIATFDAGGFRLTRYWAPRYQSSGRPRLDEYVEEFGRVLEAATARARAGPPRTTLPLSGGLDSRALLAVSPRPLDVPCITYGVPGCDDLRLAAELARLTGARHHTLELQPGFIADGIAELVRLTDGMHLGLNVHATHLQAAAAWCDVIILGNGGDSLLDGLWTWPAEPADLGLITRRAFNIYNRGLDHEVAARVLTDERYADFREGPIRRLEERLRAYAGGAAPDHLDAYNAGENHWRWTLQGVPAQTTHVEFREPFYDHAVVDFAMTVPAEFRLGRRLHVELIRRRAPDLAAVAQQGTGRALEVVPPWRRRLKRLRGRGTSVVRRARAAVLGPRVATQQRLGGFADYAWEMRNGSARALTDVLLDERTFARGWYRSDGLRTAVADHLAGRRDHALALGVILTLELWLREFVDGR